LTGEAAAEDVDWRDIMYSYLLNVVVTGDTRPMLSEDPLAVGVLLAEPLSFHSSALEAEVEAADPGEERADRESILELSQGSCLDQFPRHVECLGDCVDHVYVVGSFLVLQVAFVVVAVAKHAEVACLPSVELNADPVPELLAIG
jgi:hypothetical protein